MQRGYRFVKCSCERGFLWIAVAHERQSAARAARRAAHAFLLRARLRRRRDDTACAAVRPAAARLLLHVYPPAEEEDRKEVGLSEPTGVDDFVKRAAAKTVNHQESTATDAEAHTAVSVQVCGTESHGACAPTRDSLEFFKYGFEPTGNILGGRHW